MSTLSLQFATHPHRGLRWNDVRQKFAMCRQYSCSRSELDGLSDKCLQDIGILAARQSMRRLSHFGWLDRVAVESQLLCWPSHSTTRAELAFRYAGAGA